MPSLPATKAWVTLLTKTSYLAGALVLNQSLIKHGSVYPLVVFATEELPQAARVVLESRGIRVRDIEYLEPKGDNKAEIDEADHRFADTWTKLRCFELIEYERVVMLDSDMLVLQNMDELMTMDLPGDCIAAAHACTCNPLKRAHYPADWIPENCGHTQSTKTLPLAATAFSRPTHHLINSGLVILHPSLPVFDAMVTMLHEDPVVKTFKFPDQDLLAYFFKGKFVSLGYQYNALKTLRGCHTEMWEDKDVKNVHYILDKPWAKRITPAAPGEEGSAAHANDTTHGWWWDAFAELEASWGDSANWALVASTVAAK